MHTMLDLISLGGNMISPPLILSKRGKKVEESLSISDEDDESFESISAGDISSHRPSILKIK